MIDRFVKCLHTISHTRAGWDYDLTEAQKAAERLAEIEALAEVRTIWRDNPAEHDALRVAFRDANPLASLNEIERAP